ncbi:MAG: Rieske 2Fe-2S domain-containing protein [Polyangiaceae bacterium]|nr:Rieske 2Fe-2S domain-containing protein [Polyangiaceae bacterium]
MKPVGRVSLSALKAAGQLRVSYPPFDVCVVWSDGRVYAIEDACNHAGASLAQGRVRDGLIQCPMHGYLFALETGELVAPRGLCAAQRTFHVALEGDDAVIADPFDLTVTDASPPGPDRGGDFSD